MNKGDQEHEEKLKKIMSNADSLKGKEYLDYLLAFLKGKKDAESDGPEKVEKGKVKRKVLCKHELTADEFKKLEETLKSKSGKLDEDMMFYFNVSGGIAVLVDSLYHSQIALPLIQQMLESNKKLQDDFQREHLYDALIDFLAHSNRNSEQKTLAYQNMLIIL